MFSTVEIDVPWLERGGGRRGADMHYPLLSPPDAIRTVLTCPHWENVAPNAHVYLWVTNNKLLDGLDVLKALGVRYVTNFVWVKDKMGLGQYFRGQHELCLFGVRTKKGRPTQYRTDRKDLSSVLCAARRRHSQKPEEAYTLIENRSEGPYLSLFARENRTGWTVWGNEISNPLDAVLFEKRTST